jgi:hypothetical protein
MLVAQSAGGIKWTPSKRWSVEPARPMRAATYKAPAAPGDSEAAECAVNFFGAGQGGTVDANIKRWTGMFQTPGGQPVTGKTEKSTVNGVKVTTLDISGTYIASSGPMMASGAPKANSRMLAAIAEGKAGTVFFKFAGPKKTVTAGEAEFKAMLSSIKPE